MIRRLLLLPLLGLSLFAAACSHYRLGTGASRDFESLFIPPVETTAVLPQSSALLGTQIREAFLRDGRIRIVNTAEEADAILTVRLGALRRATLTSLPSDSGLARKFGLTLEATATLSSPKGDKTWFTDRPLRVERQVFTDDGSTTGPNLLQPVQQTQAEYAVVPTLGENLATQLRATVLDTW